MGEKIQKWFWWLIYPLLNERGQLGDPDPEPGDPVLDDPDPGGPDPEPKPADPDDPEPEPIDPDDPEPTPKPEPKPDDNWVPQDRFDDVYGKYKTTQEKFDLFKKLGPDRFYEAYPDEKPAVDPASEPDPIIERPQSMSELADTKVIGGEYAGMTLNEVAKVDPLAANDLYWQYRDNMRDQQDSMANDKRETENEITAFVDRQAQEIFGKKADALSIDEGKQIEALVKEVTEWMTDTGRGGGVLEDGFFLMYKDDLLKDAKSKSVQALVGKLREGGVKTISTGPSKNKAEGYGRFAAMSKDEVSVELERMNEAENAKFLKTAPKAVRDRFPALPWDE